MRWLLLTLLLATGCAHTTNVNSIWPLDPYYRCTEQLPTSEVMFRLAAIGWQISTHDSALVQTHYRIITTRETQTAAFLAHDGIIEREAMRVTAIRGQVTVFRIDLKTEITHVAAPRILHETLMGPINPFNLERGAQRLFNGLRWAVCGGERYFKPGSHLAPPEPDDTPDIPAVPETSTHNGHLSQNLRQ